MKRRCTAVFYLRKIRPPWSSNVTEVGLVIIAIVTSTYIFIKRFGDGDLLAVLPGVALLLTAVYVIVSRFRRKNIEKQFDQTMLGDFGPCYLQCGFRSQKSQNLYLVVHYSHCNHGVPQYVYEGSFTMEMGPDS